MLGTNPVRSVTETDMLEVQEIFATIQGEGPFAGVPAVFIRLAGCNLRCTYCDTDFESSYRQSNLRTPEQAAQRAMDIAGKACSLIVITGGEPFRQPIGLALLLHIFTIREFHVQVETAGTLWHARFDSLSHLIQKMPGVPVHHYWSIVCSPKTPKIHSAVELNALAFKYILQADDVSPLDGLPMRSTQDKERTAPVWRSPRKSLVYVQPCADGERTEENTRAAVDVCTEHGYRLCIQQHKVLGLP